MNKRIALIPLAFLLLASLACIVPFDREEGEEGDRGAAAAITALAATNQAMRAATTPQAAGATISISQASDCLAGPGPAYGKLAALEAGQAVPLIGKDTADQYWIIAIPGGSGSCWVSGQNASLHGDASGLPEVPPPPTPTP